MGGDIQRYEYIHTYPPLASQHSSPANWGLDVGVFILPAHLPSLYQTCVISQLSVLDLSARIWFVPA